MELSYGKNGPYILSGETMMSICKTLENIDFCCHRNAYSDAYTLIRKFRDDSHYIEQRQGGNEYGRNRE